MWGEEPASYQQVDSQDFINTSALILPIIAVTSGPSSGRAAVKRSRKQTDFQQSMRRRIRATVTEVHRILSNAQNKPDTRQLRYSAGAGGRTRVVGEDTSLQSPHLCLSTNKVVTVSRCSSSNITHKAAMFPRTLHRKRS